jgi:heme-degrading monooxygenase HmoA
MHLAELNIARLRYERGDPRAAEFFGNLDRVNAIAERMPGFVWRLEDESGDATAFRLTDDPTLIANLSVWESAEAFEAFVWQTVHAKFYRKREEWFGRLSAPHLVMWWVEEANRPTLAEASERLARLSASGSTGFAFGWEGLPSVKLWTSARCG